MKLLKCYMKFKAMKRKKLKAVLEQKKNELTAGYENLGKITPKELIKIIHKLKKLNENAILPTYTTDESAGADLLNTTIKLPLKKFLPKANSIK